jgi:hypothetical protein
MSWMGEPGSGLTRLAERRRGGVSEQIRLTLDLAVVGAKLAKVAT